MPSGVERARIDPKNGLLAYDGMPDAIDEVFVAGTAPTETSLPPDVLDSGGFVMEQLGGRWGRRRSPPPKLKTCFGGSDDFLFRYCQRRSPTRALAAGSRSDSALFWEAAPRRGDRADGARRRLSCRRPCTFRCRLPRPLQVQHPAARGLLGCLVFARPWLARSRLRPPAIDRWFVRAARRPRRHAPDQPRCARRGT